MSAGVYGFGCRFRVVLIDEAGSVRAAGTRVYTVSDMEEWTGGDFSGSCGRVADSAGVGGAGACDSCFCRCNWTRVATAFVPPEQRVSVVDNSASARARPREWSFALFGQTPEARRAEVVPLCAAARVEPAAACGDVVAASALASEGAAALLLRDVARASVAGEGVRLNVGAHEDVLRGWVAARGSALDVTDGRAVAALAATAGGRGLRGVLAEHVWEHLAPCEALAGAANVAAAMAPAAAFRVAVPDGWRPEFWGSGLLGAEEWGGGPRAPSGAGAPVSMEIAYGHAMVHTVRYAKATRTSPRLSPCALPHRVRYLGAERAN